MQITDVLATIDPSRLVRAAQGLEDGSYEVTLTSQGEGYVSGYVANGTQYGVNLRDGESSCSCPDSMYRHTVCKHQALLALWLIRHPEARQDQSN